MNASGRLAARLSNDLPSAVLVGGIVVACAATVPGMDAFAAAMIAIVAGILAVGARMVLAWYNRLRRYERVFIELAMTVEEQNRLHVSGGAAALHESVHAWRRQVHDARRLARDSAESLATRIALLVKEIEHLKTSPATANVGMHKALAEVIVHSEQARVQITAMLDAGVQERNRLLERAGELRAAVAEMSAAMAASGNKGIAKDGAVRSGRRILGSTHEVTRR